MGLIFHLTTITLVSFQIEDVRLFEPELFKQSLFIVTQTWQNQELSQ